MQRSQNISSLQDQTFDLCIIGAGATGAGCALDAALRGLKVVLIEKEDFAAATSSKSTKLIHGGVRYLEQAVKKFSRPQFIMVRKALKERRTLLHIAPHLTHPLALLTPCFTWIEGWYYAIGLKVYDWISGTQSIGPSKWLNKKLALKRIPTLRRNKLSSAVLYWDGQLDDRRFAMALVQTAAKHGAVAINHFSADSFGKTAYGKLDSVQATDQLTGRAHTIRAKQFVNATGPFADALRLRADAGLQPRIRVSRGVHITLPKEIMPGDTAMLIPKTADGRLVFAIPYHDRLLVGTTDDECPLTEQEFGPDMKEITYLLDYINQYLDTDIKPHQVTSGFGGLRPLLQAGGGAGTKELVRDHEVETGNSSGLISILGGKWTTYRLMAQDTIDAVEKAMGRRPSFCTTDKEILFGGKYFDKDKLWPPLLEAVHGQDDIATHLLYTYGTHALTAACLGEPTGVAPKRILPALPYTYCELRYLLEHEMACTVKDVVTRRWGVSLTNWAATLQLIPVVGAFLAGHFQWDDMRQKNHIADYADEVDRMMKTAGF